MSRNPSSRRPTLADVAAAAGVSKSTASKAMNGRGDISAETMKRVLASMEKVGYRSTTSNSPRQQRALAVVFDLPASSYIMGVLGGVLAGATERGINLFARMAPDLSHRTQLRVARQWIAEQQAAGVVGIVGLTLSLPGGLLQAASEVDIPFVIVDPVDTSHPGLVSIGSSNWSGARTAAEYLLGLGHRRIAWLGGPETSDAARDRLYGYRAALDSAGVVIDTALISVGSFDASRGAQVTRKLLTLKEPPSAIMAADDELAIGALAAARMQGMRIPEQLSIVGFDDTDKASWTSPALTTVRQHLGGMGRMAVEAVLSMADGQRPASNHVELATSLIVRESTTSPLLNF